jgi:hypothetical protein
VLHRDVAVKAPRADGFASPRDVDSFVAEARMAAVLNHPGIVRVYDVGHDAGGAAYVVMEQIDGTPLDALVRSGPLAPAKAAEIVAQVAEAVHHAHTRGLVHRDLKPGNVLVDAQGRAHVADFGLALHERVQRERAGEVCGTPGYMAPEQVAGEAHRLDGRTDIWALGAILYESLTGRKPFNGATHEELFDEILHREPKPPRQIDDRLPAKLEQVALRCLSKPVAQRYTTAADVARELRGWLADQGGTAAAPGAVEQPGAAGPRRFSTTLSLRVWGISISVGVTLGLMCLVGWLGYGALGRLGSTPTAMNLSNETDLGVRGGLPPGGTTVESAPPAAIPMHIDGGAVPAAVGLSGETNEDVPMPPESVPDVLTGGTAVAVGGQLPVRAEVLLARFAGAAVPRRQLSLDAESALPARSGDEVLLRFAWRQPTLPYVGRLGPAGSVTKLYPDPALETAEPVVRLMLPQSDGTASWQLDATARVETVILFTRSQPQGPGGDWTDFLTGVGPAPSIDRPGYAWFVDGQPVRRQTGPLPAARGWELLPDDPLVLMHRQIADRLALVAENVVGLSFTHGPAAGASSP